MSDKDVAGEDADQSPLIIIVSNRGPYTFSQRDDGTFDMQRGSGGLVTALAALAERLEVVWVAAALSEDDRAWADEQNGTPTDVEGISLLLTQPGHDAYRQYYNVIANPMLWFIQHQLWDLPRSPQIDRAMWEAWEDGYVTINRQFADAIASIVKETDRQVIVLPQDYHLYLVPHYLRQQVGMDVTIQPFIHIPWPGPDAWRMLPGQMRNAILTSLLDSDRVGFQTRKDAFNFVQTCRFYLADVHSYGSRDSITHNNGRVVQASTYPISVDVEKLDALADESETRLLKNQLINLIGDRKMILRVDRIELSKNILRGMQAFRSMLEEHPEHHGKVSLVMLLVPSRMGVTEYQDYLKQIMAEAGMINAEYSDAFWEPVRIVVGNNYERAIAAFQLYDILLVNPIADGMNLVAKEGVLVNQKDGVLVLSEHAGAFYELGDHALAVSPFDVYGTAEAMHRALIMPYEERHQRAEKLREMVKGAGVRRWFADQVDDALAALASHASSEEASSAPEADISE